MRKCKRQYVVVTPDYFHGNGTFGTYERDLEGLLPAPELGWIPYPGPEGAWKPDRQNGVFTRVICEEVPSDPAVQQIIAMLSVLLEEAHQR